MKPDISNHPPAKNGKETDAEFNVKFLLLQQTSLWPRREDQIVEKNREEAAKDFGRREKAIAIARHFLIKWHNSLIDDLVEATFSLAGVYFNHIHRNNFKDLVCVM